jgi:hypothetical protein
MRRNTGARPLAVRELWERPAPRRQPVPREGLRLVSGNGQTTPTANGPKIPTVSVPNTVPRPRPGHDGGSVPIFSSPPGATHQPAVGSVPTVATGSARKSRRSAVRVGSKVGRSSPGRAQPSERQRAPIWPSTGPVRLPFRPLDPALLDAVTTILADALVSDLSNFPDVSGQTVESPTPLAHPQTPPDGA